MISEIQQTEIKINELDSKIASLDKRLFKILDIRFKAMDKKIKHEEKLVNIKSELEINPEILTEVNDTTEISMDNKGYFKLSSLKKGQKFKLSEDAEVVFESRECGRIALSMVDKGEHIKFVKCKDSNGLIDLLHEDSLVYPIIDFEISYNDACRLGVKEMFMETVLKKETVLEEDDLDIGDIF